MPRTKEATAIDKQIGARLRARRLSLGISQELLGDKLGITFQQVQKYEKGSNRVSGSRMVHIAAVLDCQPSYFFGGDSKADGAAIDATAAFVTDSASRRMLQAFARIEKSSVRAALAMLAEALANEGL